MSPERSERRAAILARRVRKALSKAGVHVGGDHLIAPLVELVQSECEALRDRSAGIVIRASKQGRPTPEQMVRLAFIVRQHYIDEDGVEQVAVDEASPP